METFDMREDKMAKSRGKFNQRTKLKRAKERMRILNARKNRKKIGERWLE